MTTLLKDDPAKPYKAYVSSVLALLAMVAYAWVTDDTPKKSPEFTMEEFKDTLAWALVASGVVGTGTFLKGNPKKVEHNNVEANAMKKNPLPRKGYHDEDGQSPLTIALVVLLVVIVLIILIPRL